MRTHPTVWARVSARSRHPCIGMDVIATLAVACASHLPISAIDDKQPGNSWFASELRWELPGGHLDTHIHQCGVLGKDQTITEEVKHSPHASDQTVQMYITNVVTVVHEEVFDILEEHDMQLIVTPPVQKVSLSLQVLGLFSPCPVVPPDLTVLITWLQPCSEIVPL
jgi:hypothetical protein